MRGRMGGVGTRTGTRLNTRMSAAVDVGAGGGAWLRRTFAVGRLTRRSAELQIARAHGAGMSRVVWALGRGHARCGPRTVH